MKSRESGIDLIRCLGLLFVVGVHSFLKNGFYSEPQTGAVIWAANSFRWLFFCCNGIFMILTGYLKSTKPWNRDYYRSLISVLVSYLLTCVVSFPIRHFLLGEKLTFFQWLEKLVTFANYSWYVEMYIGLFLLSPIINLALERVTEPKKLLLLSGTMVALTALHSVTALNLIPDYWNATYPVTYYVLGAVIRRLQPKLPRWLCLGGVAVIAMGLGLATYVTAVKNFNDGFGQGYGGFWITAMVVLLFLGLYQVRVGKTGGKVLAWMAGGCFEGYILSRLLDVWVYDLVPQWHTPEKYPLLFLCVTVPIFILALLAGKGVNLLTQLLMKFTARKKLKTP